jgi:RNA polymerase sigma factor (sigma-70 family)
MGAVEFDRMLLDNREFLQPFAFSLTRDNESAKDLLQETIYRALANREKYNTGTNIKAWLYTIMRNIFINNYRRKSRQTVIFDPSPNDFLINQNQSAVTNKAELVLNMKELEKAVHELPVIFKKPFQLYCDGYKYHEIAVALQEPLGTIKSRIHFARKLLKAQIDRN